MESLIINNADAYERYGIILADSGFSALRKPAPNKPFVESKSRLQHGKRVIVKNPRKDERQLILPIEMCAVDKTDFLAKYDLFVSEVLDGGEIILSTSSQPNVFYRCLYDDCQQYTEFIQESAKFMLALTEPNPNNRGKESNEQKVFT